MAEREEARRSKDWKRATNLGEGCRSGDCSRGRAQGTTWRPHEKSARNRERGVKGQEADIQGELEKGFYLAAL